MLSEPWYKEQDETTPVPEVHCKTPGVTDQAHNYPLGLQMPGPSQLGNNHTMGAPVEVSHHRKSTEGDSLGHYSPA